MQLKWRIIPRFQDLDEHLNPKNPCGCCPSGIFSALNPLVSGLGCSIPLNPAPNIPNRWGQQTKAPQNQRDVVKIMESHSGAPSSNSKTVPHSWSPGMGEQVGGPYLVPFTCDPGLNHSGRNQNAKLQVEDLFPGGGHGGETLPR